MNENRTHKSATVYEFDLQADAVALLMWGRSHDLNIPYYYTIIIQQLCLIEIKEVLLTNITNQDLNTSI